MSATAMIESIKRTFATESDQRLLEIWALNDTNTYSPDAFAAIREILTERGLSLPPQQPPPALPPASPRRAGLASMGVFLVVIGWLSAIALDQLFRESPGLQPLCRALSALSALVLLCGLGCLLLALLRRLTRPRTPPDPK